MSEQHGFLKLTLDTGRMPGEGFNPFWILTHEIAVLEPHEGWTTLHTKAGTRYFVKETPEEIFQLMEELHKKMVALAKHRMERNWLGINDSTKISDPGPESH